MIAKVAQVGRTDHDDASWRVAADHVLRGLAGAEVGAVDVDVHELLELVGGVVDRGEVLWEGRTASASSVRDVAEGRGRTDDTGSGDEDVNTTELLNDLAEAVLDVFLVRDVAPETHRLDLALLGLSVLDEPGRKVVGSSLRLSLVEVEDDDRVRARLGERAREKVSETTRGSGHDADLDTASTKRWRRRVGGQQVSEGLIWTDLEKREERSEPTSIPALGGCMRGPRRKASPPEWGDRGRGTRFRVILSGREGRGGTYLVGHGEGGERTALVTADVDVGAVHRVSEVCGGGRVSPLLFPSPSVQHASRHTLLVPLIELHGGNEKLIQRSASWAEGT